MNKTLRKAVEAELTTVITATLSSRNKAATAKISKNIREGVKSIAKKFTKQSGKTAKKKPAGKAIIKVAASPAKTAKKKTAVKRLAGDTKKI